MDKTHPDYYKMTPAREAHLRDIKFRVLSSLDAKYRTGQSEHGDDLFEKFSQEDFLREIENELIDLIVYVYTLRAQIYGETDRYRSFNNDTRSSADSLGASQHAPKLGESQTNK